MSAVVGGTAQDGHARGPDLGRRIAHGAGESAVRHGAAEALERPQPGDAVGRVAVEQRVERRLRAGADRGSAGCSATARPRLGPASRPLAATPRTDGAGSSSAASSAAIPSAPGARARSDAAISRAGASGAPRVGDEGGTDVGCRHEVAQARTAFEDPLADAAAERADQGIRRSGGGSRPRPPCRRARPRGPARRPARAPAGG